MTPAGTGCHLPGSPCPSMAGSLLKPALLQRSPWFCSPAPSSSGAGRETTPHLWPLWGEMPLFPGMCLLPSPACARTPGSPFHPNSPHTC